MISECIYIGLLPVSGPGKWGGLGMGLVTLPHRKQLCHKKNILARILECMTGVSCSTA